MNKYIKSEDTLMKKRSAAYTEHVLALFNEILHESITHRPLQQIGDGITPALAHGLQFLFQHGVCSVRDVGQGLTMTYSAASQLVERLVRKGWVTRRDNEHDRRLSEIRLTDQGRELVEKIRYRRVADMSRILDKMDPDSRAALVENLEKFIAAAVNDAKSALNTCAHCGRDHLSDCVLNEIYRAETGSPIKKI